MSQAHKKKHFFLGYFKSEMMSSGSKDHIFLFLLIIVTKKERNEVKDMYFDNFFKNNYLTRKNLKFPKYVEVIQ